MGCYGKLEDDAVCTIREEEDNDNLRGGYDQEEIHKNISQLLCNNSLSGICNRTSVAHCEAMR